MRDYGDESIQDLIEAAEEEMKVEKSLGSRPGGVSDERFRKAFEVDDMLEYEPDSRDVFLSEMKNDTSEPGFDPDEEYDVDDEEEIEFLDDYDGE